MSDNPYAEDFNPYRAPVSMATGDGVHNQVEAIRKEHLSHEASVKSVGVLYLLGGIFGTIAVVTLFVTVGNAVGQGRGVVGGAEFGIVLVLLVLSVAQIATAIGLRRLQPWARIVAGILSGIGLLGFPLGTLISGYILYLLFSAKGAMVFSEEYKSVIEQTPHIVYKTSIIVWIFLCLLLGLIGLGMLAMFIG